MFQYQEEIPLEQVSLYSPEDDAVSERERSTPRLCLYDHTREIPWSDVVFAD